MQLIEYSRVGRNRQTVRFEKMKTRRLLAVGRNSGPVESDTKGPHKFEANDSRVMHPSRVLVKGLFRFHVTLICACVYFDMANFQTSDGSTNSFQHY